MSTGLNAATLRDIFQQRCPRCRLGRIFRKSIFWGFPRMNERCLVCDLKFEREEGYFLGAMYISYGLALAAIGALAVLMFLFTHLSPAKVILWSVVLFMPLAPSITLFSRVLWIYLDQSLDPDLPRT